MIPKIIHYAWFSGEPFPPNIQECIDSWYKYMPEYEYILWDQNRIKEIDSVWLRECLEKRKWAYAADMVRLYAIHKYGGIYLDTDSLVYRSFNDLLQEPCFIGKENSMHIESGFMEQYLSSHCFGAEAGNEFIKSCLSYYDRHFVISEDDTLPMRLKWNIVLLPFIQSEIAKQRGYCPYPSANRMQKYKDVTIYPQEFFDCNKITSTSYCKHLALGSWREEKLEDEKITIWYKIRWRVEFLMKMVLDKCGYLMIKKM